MKNTIQDVTASVFVGCIIVLTIVSVLGVWNFFSGDVITKSFQTIGLLGLVALIVLLASNYLGDSGAIVQASVSRPGFRALRNTTLVLLIIVSVFLALIGVMAIWNVITDQTVLNKSISSLSIVGFASLIVVLVSLQRENNDLWQKRGRELTGSGVIAAILFLILLQIFWH